MRKTIPESTINKISNTIKQLRRNRPVSPNSTGRNLSHDMLYKPGTEGLNNRLFKSHPSRFIAVDKKKKMSKSFKYEGYTLDILKEYYEEEELNDYL